MPKSLQLLLVFAIAIIQAGCGKSKNSDKVTGRISDPQIARYVAANRRQAEEIAKAGTNKVPANYWKFFDAVGRDDMHAATNLDSLLSQERASSESGALQSELWHVYAETTGAYEMYCDFDGKWLHRFANDIITSIPKNSIYFGGTDPGRYIISAYCETHTDGRPFFSFAQNVLADGTYLDYLRLIYGGNIQISTPSDSQRAIKEYLDDAQLRLQTNGLSPSEDVKIVDNRVQVSGQVALMKVNARIAKVIVDKNPDRECYVEESFSMEWMYPQLEPHGLILKLNRQPLLNLDDQAVAKDRDYWKSYTKELIGDWVTEKTSMKEICEFGEKVFFHEDFGSFEGDRAYAVNSVGPKIYSKLRCSIAGLYAWRAEHSKTDEEKQRMLREADWAFRQALALCPYGPDVNDRYADFLLKQGRKSEAQTMIKCFLHFKPSEKDLNDLPKRVGLSK